MTAATGAGAWRAQNEFCLAIELDGISYLVHYEPYGRWDYVPTNLIVGDPISVRTKGDNLWFLTGKPNEDSAKTRHLRSRNVTDVFTRW